VSGAKNFLANVTAVTYFIAIMLATILLLIFAPVMLLGDIRTIQESGFASSNAGLAFIGGLGLFIGISLIFPAFRRMYYKLPWLFPLVKIFYVNVVITAIANMIMNYGYEVQDETRHVTFFALAIIEIVIGRILMNLWFNKRKVEYIGRQTNV